jgi:Rieske Fe-S protein
MSDTNTRVSRRQFCAGCMMASGGTLATLVSGCGGSPTSPGGNASTLSVLPGQFADSAVRVPVAGSALDQAGGAVLVESVAGVFLVSRTNENSFAAVDAVCTHEGCTITDADGSIYVCPCHGSRYDRNGQVIAGPARASLRRYTSTFSGGVLTIAL